MTQAGDSPGQSPVIDNQMATNTNGESHENPVDSGCKSHRAVATRAPQHANITLLSGCASAPDLTSPQYSDHNQQGAPQDDNISSGTRAHISPETQSSLRDEEDSVSSRIPRGTGLRQPANSSDVKGSRFRSSIPIAVHRRSAEQLGTTLQGRQNEPSPGGIRPVDKPRGPRPRPPSEVAPIPMSEPAEGMEQVSEPEPLSTSCSSTSTWDFKDIGDPERPATVFTGEYRTRTLATPGRQTPGPTLRISTSAENIIMGAAIREPSNSTVTHVMNPVLAQRLGKLSPRTPKDTKSPRGATPGSRGTPGSKTSAGSSKGSTPVSRNFCRPQISLDSIQKRDISAKELSIARKPLSKSSLSSLFSPSSKSLRDEEPMVPKIPEKYIPSPENSMSQGFSRVIDSATPVKVASGPKCTPSNPGPEVTPMPATAIKAGTMYHHPPRTSSLQALSDFPGGFISEKRPTVAAGVPSKVATHVKRNVTFNDIAPFASDNEQSGLSAEKPKLPESRSNHLLGSFRNIFRSRSGVVDKERVKMEEGDAPTPANENQAPGNDKATAKTTQLPNDPRTSLKLRAKYTRLPSGVNWNRSSRSPKTAGESPTTPTPSIPRLLAPPNRLPDGSMPSFAQPTKSTRTKATSAPKGHVSTTPEIHTRRPHLRTDSTGSPQRLNRSSRRTTGNVLMLAAQKRTNQSPASVTGKTGAHEDVPPDCIPKNLDAIRNFLETLCQKVKEAPNPLERERHIRLALRLQQQLADYQSIEKAALETESAAKDKQLERKVAEESLNTSVAEIQSELEQD